MSRVRVRWATCLMLVALALTASPAFAEDEADDPTFGGLSLDEGFGVVGTHHLAPRIDDTPMTTSDATLRDVVSLYEEHEVVCSLRQYADEEGVLQNDEVDLCDTEDGLSAAEIVALVSQEFRTLPLVAPAVTHQPGGDWALVNMDFIVYTDAEVQVLETTILGVPVAVRATPVHYEWDFGDGSAPLATTDAGSPYPNQTVAHVYSDAVDEVAVTLTTSWQGELQIAGSGTWLPIAGMAVTTSTTDAVEIVAMDVHLVPNA